MVADSHEQQRERTAKPWWGEARVPVGETRRWRVGPRTLWVTRLAFEWRVAHCAGDDPLEGGLEVAAPDAEPAADAPDVDWLRFGRATRGEHIHLVPALADRSIVSHPTLPFHVLPGEQVRLFVSSPLWLRLEVEAPRQKLCELPIVRPSDTWVGGPTDDGEAAYSSRTACRLDLDELPFRPHRAVTPVVVRNHSDEAMRLERITVAVRHLSLYRDSGATLWTDEITLTREDHLPDAELRIHRGAPPEALGNERLAEPRDPLRENRLRRAVAALF